MNNILKEQQDILNKYKELNDNAKQILHLSKEKLEKRRKLVDIINKMK